MKRITHTETHTHTHARARDGKYSHYSIRYIVGLHGAIEYENALCIDECVVFLSDLRAFLSPLVFYCTHTKTNLHHTIALFLSLSLSLWLCACVFPLSLAFAIGNQWNPWKKRTALLIHRDLNCTVGDVTRNALAASGRAISLGWLPEEWEDSAVQK